MEISVDAFFNGKNEKSINQRMLYYAYSFPLPEMQSYYTGLNKIPIENYLDYILANKQICEIEPSDVFQFSSFKDGTLGVCQKINSAGDPGLKPAEIGRLLLNDGIERKQTAYVKYGENHVKTAELLGLTFQISKTYFLSSTGKTYISLSKEEQDKLMTRLILRNKLIRRVIAEAIDGNCNMRELLLSLADSTYLRRSSNLRTIIQVLNASDEYDFNRYLNNIIY